MLNINPAASLAQKLNEILIKAELDNINSKNKNILYITGFNHEFPHGGVKRSMQIIDELSKAFTTIVIETKHVRQAIKFVGNWIKYTLQMAKVFLMTKGSLSEKLKSSALCGAINFFIERENPYFIVYDFTRNTNKYLWIILENTNVPVIAVIQNIEFLVTSSDTLASNMINLQNQFKAIKHAELSITISTIDDYICRIYGANTLLFPYFPSSEVDTFRKIARDRWTSRSIVRNKILILGTAYNKPTRLGIENLLANVDRWKSDNDELLLAGFGTDEYFNSTYDVKVLGGLSQSELYAIFIEVKCCVIFQPPTTGKLTKLAELEMCKVPVFINSDYISAEESGLLKKYCDFDQLRTLIDS